MKELAWVDQRVGNVSVDPFQQEPDTMSHLRSQMTPMSKGEHAG